jgi:transposase
MQDSVKKGRCKRAPGEKNAASKLTEKQVVEIRERFSNGTTKEDLAKEFCVSISNIALIVRRAAWRCV